MWMSTVAIQSNGQIDSRYTCDSDDSSPEIHWKGEPAGTQSFALLIDDPDAPYGVFTHWLIYNIPVQIHHLPAGIPSQEVMPNGICQGINSFGKLGYSGPCPPLGSAPHHYYFKLFALKKTPNIRSRIKKDELLREISSDVLATAEVVGTYQRRVMKAG